MFTGIVAEIGSVTQTRDFSGGRELHIACSFGGETHIDESISVNGVCLTVVGKSDKTFSVQCVEETLRKTTLSSLSSGSIVNLERSMTLDKGIEGHIVQGHVDTVGKVEAIDIAGEDRLITLSYPEEFQDYIVGRGSITVDGISLTVARDNNSSFTVAIIPYTWNETNLHRLSTGDEVNLEFDIFGKYIVKYLKNRG